MDKWRSSAFAANDAINIVLMDIMMPVMDGHEAMRQIRLQKKYANLPIITLTAKAMQEERRKCVEAGASDYLTKPVDVDKLIAMMRIWLYQEVT
jgi:CheY-like chemotaxis protein